ncbi:uncharacterized protein LOC143084194 [Mytilus galloprovincialis]|uniref:uncharacterized protein LOC143084194 n=1 Tax=Mytilus galloprovincialis TaxID=29158 RepID=UPI003F7B5C2E
MSIRSAICHPSSSHSYSVDELEKYWSDLESAVVLLAEPKCYKDIVEMQVETLKNCKLNGIESAKVIEKMKAESNKILHAIQTVTPLKIDDIEKLITDRNCELEKCLKSEINKTKSYMNDTFQEFKDEVMDVKTDLKELMTIMIGYIDKQKVDLVMNTGQIEKSIESPDNIKVDFTATVNQTHVTADKENEIIENLPLEIKIQTKNDCLSEEAVTETIEITGKKVNSIILELKATPGILHSVENFKAAILTLVRVMQKVGGIDADIEDTVTVNLKVESPLTEDQFAVVKCLFAKEWNADNDTTQLPETSEVFQLETTKPLTKTFCQLCDNKDMRIKALEEQNEKHEIVIMRNMLDLQAEKRKLEDLQAEKRKLEGKNQ